MAKLRYDVYIDDTADPDEKDCSLNLIRFPAMRSQFENHADLIQLHIKPKSLKLKVDVLLDTKSSNYCPAQAANLGGKSVPKIFPQNVIDKISYISSTKTPVDDDQLFVAKLINNKIVCRPISHIITMRSDFSHFDLKDEVDPKEEIKPISVKFAAADRQNVPSKSTNTNVIAVEEDPLDEFTTIQYKNLASREAMAQRVKLFGKPEPKVKAEPEGSQVDKKPHLAFYPDIKLKAEKMDVDDIYSEGESGSSQQSSPKKSNVVKQRVKDCLLKARVVSFEEVYRFVKDYGKISDNVQLSNKDILDALVEFAVLVQGNWAIKSEILYGDSSVKERTDVTGISINLFTAARDYLLWLLTQDRFVNRLDYSNKVRMPDHDVLELFNQLCTFHKETRLWEFKLATDERFLNKFAEVVQRQATLWKVRKANKLAIFNR